MWHAASACGVSQLVKLAHTGGGARFPGRKGVQKACSSLPCAMQHPLQEALHHMPDDTLLSLLLCHTYVVAGKLQRAQAVAHAAVTAAPHDADAHLLLAFMQHMAAARTHGEEGEEGPTPGLTPGSASQARRGASAFKAAHGRGGGGMGDGSEEHAMTQVLMGALEVDPTSLVALEGGCAMHACMHVHAVALLALHG